MLSEKEKILVGIGAAISAGCQPCTHSLIRAARAAGACERSIRLAIETGLAARRSATEAMDLWASTEQGEAPVIDAGFRLEKEKLATLISIGATYAANSTATLPTQIEEAQLHDWTDVQMGEAFAVGSAVARTAAAKVELAARRLGIPLTALDSSCCGDPPVATATPVSEPGRCDCAKSAQDP
jgi:alkylhydroperoxidase/carboxymuconolactone decarboxylase family protein YurZ